MYHYGAKRGASNGLIAPCSASVPQGAFAPGCPCCGRTPRQLECMPYSSMPQYLYIGIRRLGDLLGTARPPVIPVSKQFGHDRSQSNPKGLAVNGIEMNAVNRRSADHASRIEKCTALSLGYSPVCVGQLPQFGDTSASDRLTIDLIRLAKMRRTDDQNGGRLLIAPQGIGLHDLDKSLHPLGGPEHGAAYVRLQVHSRRA